MKDLCERSWFGKDFGDIYKDKPSCFISELGKGGSPPWIFDFNFDYGEYGTSIRQLFEDNKLAKDKKSSSTYEITYGFKTISQADIAPSRSLPKSPLPSRGKAKDKKAKETQSDTASSASVASTASTTISSSRKRAGSIKVKTRKPPMGTNKFKAPPPIKSEPYFSIKPTRSLRSGRDRRNSESELEEDQEEEED